MKATPLQKNLIQEIQNHISAWENSNDLDSPSHYCYMEDEIRKLERDDLITKDDAKKFEDILADLYDFVKSKK